jgi:hypothetical protein
LGTLKVFLSVDFAAARVRIVGVLAMQGAFAGMALPFNDWAARALRFDTQAS